jgi:CRP-like cAMP-binding protein
LSSTHLGAIAQHAEEEFFPQGSFLLHPSQPREAFFVIVQGRVSVRTPGRGEEIRGPGEAVGFLQLLAKSEEVVEARALWDTTALRVDWDAHLDVCERHFPILEAHMEFLAKRCQEETDLLRLGGHPPPDRSRLDAHLEEGRVGAPSPALDLVQRMVALHRCSAFPSTNMDALAELSRHLREVNLLPGVDVWKEGDVSDSFLLVVSGTLARESANGVREEEFGPGDVVGRFEALGDLPRHSHLRARAPTVALEVTLESLLDILEDHFNLAVDFTAELAKELIHLLGSGPVSPTKDEIL